MARSSWSQAQPPYLTVSDGPETAAKARQSPHIKVLGEYLLSRRRLVFGTTIKESMRYCSTCSHRASLLIVGPGGNRERQLQLQRLTRMYLAPQLEQSVRYPSAEPTIAV